MHSSENLELRISPCDCVFNRPRAFSFPIFCISTSPALGLSFFCFFSPLSPSLSLPLSLSLYLSLSLGHLPTVSLVSLSLSLSLFISLSLSQCLSLSLSISLYTYIYAVKLKADPMFALFIVKHWSIFVFLFSTISFSLQKEESFSKNKREQQNNYF